MGRSMTFCTTESGAPTWRTTLTTRFRTTTRRRRRGELEASAWQLLEKVTSTCFPTNLCQSYSAREGQREKNKKEERGQTNTTSSCFNEINIIINITMRLCNVPG